MRRLAFAAAFVAFGVCLPLLFHGLGMGGPVFLPMHIPVLLGGLSMGPGAGLAIGLVTPVLSWLLTGMPPVQPPILFLMLFELGTYGLVAGWLAGVGRRSLFPALVGALIAGRLALGLAVALASLALGFKATPVAYVAGALVSGLPGLALQLVTVPALARLMDRLPPELRPGAPSWR